jgi:hypothetical protein
MRSQPITFPSFGDIRAMHSVCIHTDEAVLMRERNARFMSRMVMSLNGCTAAKKTNQNNKVETIAAKLRSIYSTYLVKQQELTVH